MTPTTARTLAAAARDLAPVGTGDPDVEAKQVREALAEIAEAWSRVDMTSQPEIPSAAPCRAPDADPEDWHDPLRHQVVAVHPKFLDKIAADLCAGCPIIGECLNWGLANPVQGGILGGLTEDTRRALRRRNRRRTA